MTSLGSTEKQFRENKANMHAFGSAIFFNKFYEKIDEELKKQKISLPSILSSKLGKK